ncbi:di-trans,poly-cis-decaprenylcistransferase, partial [Candidatus Woesearchaeota archaeon]|nr:di-trans,poly-cis-decaprenylcistransferase [Candidatus Woesearchaeota archaeon]
MDNKIPGHIAIILDGNRRWAKARGLPEFKGHEKGLEKIKEALQWCMEAGVKELTLYCFSTENFKRGKEEIDFLFNLLRKKISVFSKDPLFKGKVKITTVGRISMFPQELQHEMNRVMEETKNNREFTLNLAMAYGARAEILDAVSQLVLSRISQEASEGEHLTEDDIKNNLYVSRDVDLLIRPGGEKRM